MTPEILESGYWQAYQEFYRWSAIWRGAATKDSARGRLLEAILGGFGARPAKLG